MDRDPGRPQRGEEPAVPRPQTGGPRIDWRVATAVLVVGVLLFATLSVPVTTGNGVARFQAQIRSQGSLWGIWFLLLPLVFAASRRAHRYGIPSARGFAVHLAACVTLSLLHCILWGMLRWATNNPANNPLMVMVRFMVSFVFASDLLRYMTIASVYHVLALQREARARIVSEAQLRAKLAEARLEALEARLHPHFLFNTLNTISSLIRTNPPAAITVVEHLGELLRAALQSDRGREVPLATELQLIGQYVAIQQARFSDRLRVSIDAPPETAGALVPQLILQPIVENAVRHGIAPRESPGSIRVDARRAGDMLRLTVRDDGVGYDGSPRTNGNGSRVGIGLSNTRERLVELYGDRASLVIAAGEDGRGTIVTIDIPFRS